MRILRQILTVLICVATLVAGVLFALQNREPVALDLLVHTFAPRSVALWVLGAFALGGVGGILASSLVIVQQRTARAAANRQLEKARLELDRLRTAGLAPRD